MTHVHDLATALYGAVDGEYHLASVGTPISPWERHWGPVRLRMWRGRHSLRAGVEPNPEQWARLLEARRQDHIAALRADWRWRHIASDARERVIAAATECGPWDAAEYGQPALAREYAECAHSRARTICGIPV